MNYSNGLTYKTKITRGIDELLTTGALVHMFEFKDATQMSYLENLCNAMIGKQTGAYSTHRALDDMCFNEDNQLFQALPTSAIRKEYPLSIYTNYNNVGVMIDPSTVDFIAISPNLIGNGPTSDRVIRFTNTNFFNDPHIYNVNKGRDAIALYGDPGAHGEPGYVLLNVNIYRSDEDKANLRELFDNYFWEKYSGGVDASDKDVFEHIKKNLTELARKVYIPGMTSEILANVPRNAVKAIIFSPESNLPKEAAYLASKDIKMNGMMTAVLVNQFVQKNLGVNLPIIQYHQPEVNLNKNIMTKPGFNEIEIEMDKVRKVLATDPVFAAAYGHLLGKDRVRDIISGKTNSSYLG